MRSSVLTATNPELRAEIEDLNAAYAQTIDDDKIEQWPDFFTDDAAYAIIPRENVELGYEIGIVTCRNRAMMLDRVVAIRQASLYGPHRYRHIISRSLVTIGDAGEVSAVTPFVVFQMRTDPIDFGKTETYALGEYRDRYHRSDAGLLLQKRVVVLDNSTVKTLLATPL
jgi:anthranilate 1,2-dioxygenase small subunit